MYACDKPRVCVCDKPHVCDCDKPHVCSSIKPHVCVCDKPYVYAYDKPHDCACDRSHVCALDKQGHIYFYHLAVFLVVFRLDRGIVPIVLGVYIVDHNCLIFGFYKPFMYSTNQTRFIIV